MGITSFCSGDDSDVGSKASVGMKASGGVGNEAAHNFQEKNDNNVNGEFEGSVNNDNNEIGESEGSTLLLEDTPTNDEEVFEGSNIHPLTFPLLDDVEVTPIIALVGP